MAWFSDDQREAFEDFWSIYVRRRESVRNASAWFGASEQSVDDERRALSGDPTSLRGCLARRGAARADEGASLHSALEEARLLGRSLMPPLVEAYAGEPARLARALALVNDLGDFGAATVGEAYLERKAAAVRAQEEALAQTLRYWERVFQHATWGIALAGIDDLLFKAVNPMYAQMHGYTVDELMGNKVSTLWTAETQADMQRHAHETREHGRLVAETTHLCKDGSTLPVEVVATTIADERGKLAWFVANVQDITERRRHQQSRIRAVELEAENRRIDEANRLKSEFLANMSHELRTPLNSVIGFAELLHDEQVGPIDEKQKEFLGDILTGASHLLRLINDVLDLSKVEAGKMDFRPEPVVLPSLVAKVIQSLSAVVSKKQLKVDVSAAPGLDDVTLDPSRFKQLLYNYVSNALKFTPEGGQISVRLLPDAPSTFRLEVEDTGPGVPERDVHRLFVPFQQLDSGVAKAHGGTGLGLALTKQLAEAQGGTVGMRRGTQGGSIFYAVLPRRPTESTAKQARRADSPRATLARSLSARGTPVIVVDDDPSSLKLMEATLGQLGYEALCFSTGADALSASERVRPLAVVLDLLMPSMDGFAFVEHFRASAENRAVPVLIWTVKDLSAEERARLGDVPVSVVQKGVDDGEPLSAALRAFLPARGESLE